MSLYADLSGNGKGAYAQKAVAGAFTAAGQSDSLALDLRGRRGSPSTINLSLWGTFVGTVKPERSFDNGTTWTPLTALGSAIAFTAPASETFEEGESVALYRLNCTAYTSGTINYRMN